jgi:hypothetical protein
MEGILLDTMFDLPSLEGVEEVVISKEVVEGTARRSTSMPTAPIGPATRAHRRRAFSEPIRVEATRIRTDHRTSAIALVAS